MEDFSFEVSPASKLSKANARVAELEAEVSRLKTVPMKYRRMKFNAELQDRVTELEQQLTEASIEFNSCSSVLSDTERRVEELEAQLAAYKESTKRTIEQLSKKDKLLQQQTFALADTEALEIAHGERIEKLTKLLLLAKDALEKFIDSHEECEDFDGFTAQIVSMDDYHEAQEALAAINDSKLVKGLILCDAETGCWYDGKKFYESVEAAICGGLRIDLT